MNNLESGFHPPLTVLELEISSARWVERALAPDFATVGALVPDGFSSYVRLFHPAKTTDGQQVRWAEVARWSGRKVHALMSFEGISSVADGYGTSPAPWVEDPLHGSLDKQDALELATFLGPFTRTPERCFFAVWDGYGQFHPGGMAKLSRAGGEPQFPPNAIKDAQRIKGVGRDYLLYSGPLSSISSFFVGFWHDSPNLWWPADQEWCVATDIDLDSTYLGGTDACMEALRNHPLFEVLPIDRDDSTYVTADTYNLS